MTVRLTTEKKKKVFDLCQEVLLKESSFTRLVSKLLGKLTISFQFIKYGQPHCSELERLKTEALNINKGNFDKEITIDPHVKQDKIRYKNNILRSLNTIRIENLSFTTRTDASTTVWWAVFKNTSTGGKFSVNETLMHINTLKLKAIPFGLRSFCDHICDSHIKILSDHTTAVHCMNNMGSCRSVDCDKIIWDWAIKRRLLLSSAHIPGRLNRDADEESRKLS